MKYKLKSKIPSAIKHRGTMKASYALFIKFLNSKEALEDYIDCLLTDNKILGSGMRELEDYVMDVMQNGGPEGILDSSLYWDSCQFPEVLPEGYESRERYWGDLHSAFYKLHAAFKEEVLNVG